MRAGRDLISPEHGAQRKLITECAVCRRSSVIAHWVIAWMDECEAAT